MYRRILIALTAGVILLAFAALPPMLPGSTTLNLSGSAQAQKTPTPDAIQLNTSRSNIYREEAAPGGAKGAPEKQTGTPTPPNTGGAAQTTTVKSSKSNSSE